MYYVHNNKYIVSHIYNKNNNGIGFQKNIYTYLPTNIQNNFPKVKIQS